MDAGHLKLRIPSVRDSAYRYYRLHSAGRWQLLSFPCLYLFTYKKRPYVFFSINQFNSHQSLLCFTKGKVGLYELPILSQSSSRARWNWGSILRPISHRMAFLRLAAFVRTELRLDEGPRLSFERVFDSLAWVSTGIVWCYIWDSLSSEECIEPYLFCTELCSQRAFSFV